MPARRPRPAGRPALVLLLAALLAPPLLVAGGCGDPAPRPSYDPPPARPDDPSLAPSPPPDPPGLSGSAPTPAAPSQEELGQRVRERLEALFSVVRGPEAAPAAPFIVYRGDQDRARRWKDVCNYAVPTEAAQVDAAVRRLRKLLEQGGAPRFLHFEVRDEGDQVWLAWNIAFGEGSTAKRAVIACLETPAGIAVGDIDT